MLERCRPCVELFIIKYQILSTGRKLAEPPFEIRNKNLSLEECCRVWKRKNQCWRHGENRIYCKYYWNRCYKYYDGDLGRLLL